MEQIEYTRTVVPSSMRSPYWKYFGFPSDNSNKILTRQKVVCTICNTAIAYNKNTSNLRTHLMSKHIEMFQRIVMAPTSETLDQVSDKNFNQTTSGEYYMVENFSTASCKRLCRGPQGDREGSNMEWGTNTGSETFLIVPESINCNTVKRKKNSQIQYCNYLNLEDNFNVPDLVEVVEGSDEEINDSIIENAECEQTALALEPTNDMHDKKLAGSIEISLADMVQTDLLSLDALTREGFCKYNQQLTGIRIGKETIERIMEVIEERFTKTQQIIDAHVAHLSHMAPFSLSIEIYEDEGHDNILNIYYNYLNVNNTQLVSVLYKGYTISNYTSTKISDLLSDINIKNCGGIVVPSLENVQDLILDFANCYEIPLVECLESTLTHCLQKIYESSEISEVFRKVIQKEKKFLYNKNLIPKHSCTWSKLEALENISENLKEQELGQWQELKNFVDYLKPLKIVLDIVADELLISCSLIRPLIIKLYEDIMRQTKFKSSVKIRQIKKILQKDLYERILIQDFLKEATFFDPRFQRRYAFSETLCDFRMFKSHIIKRFKSVLNITDIKHHEKITTKDTRTDFMTNSGISSSLKTFFKRDLQLQNSEILYDVKTDLDVELEQYHLKGSLDLEQSPAVWWHQVTNNYKQLSKIAKFYLTVPCCYMPRLCRLDSKEKLFILDRRKRLNQLCRTESKLWYLFYNSNWSASE